MMGSHIQGLHMCPMPDHLITLNMIHTQHANAFALALAPAVCRRERQSLLHICIFKHI